MRRALLLIVVLAGCTTTGMEDRAVPMDLACDEPCGVALHVEPGSKVTGPTIVRADPSGSARVVVLENYLFCESSEDPPNDCLLAAAPGPVFRRPGSVDRYVRVFVSEDGGRSFMPARFAAEDRAPDSADATRLDFAGGDRGTGARMAILGTGRIVVLGARVGALPDGHSLPEARVTWSDDGGRTFVASRPAAALPQRVAGEGFVTAGPATFGLDAEGDDLLACWSSQAAGSSGAFLGFVFECTVSHDGGATWSSAQEVGRDVALAAEATSRPFWSGPSPAVNDGTFHLAWIKQESGELWAMLSTSSDGGATWSASAIAPASAIIGLDANEAGLLLAAAEGEMDGGTFEVWGRSIAAGGDRETFRVAWEGPYERLLSTDVVRGKDHDAVTWGSIDLDTIAPAVHVAHGHGSALWTEHRPTRTAPGVGMLGNAVIYADVDHHSGAASLEVQRFVLTGAQP